METTGSITNSDLTFVKNLRHQMKEHSFMLCYCGSFSQTITKALLAMTEKKMDTDGTDKSIKKKVFNVMVECLQNIAKHGDSDEAVDKDALFMIGRTGDDYVTYSGNMILREKVEGLRSKLMAINTMEKDEIKELYKTLIMAKGLSEKAGAGLGLIDIAKKSGNKLEFDFKDVRDDSCFFALKTLITKVNNE